MTVPRSGPRTFIITRVGVSSLAGWGFAIGALIVCLPAFLCSALFFQLTFALHLLLDSWQEVGVSLFGQKFTLDFLALLHLQRFARVLADLAALGLLGMLLLAMLVILMSGFLVAVALAFLGLFYNLTGRIHIDLAEA